MYKILNLINKYIHRISITFVIILFSVIIIGMLCINSIYLYVDKPDFQANNIWNYLGIIINILVIGILIIISKFKIFSKNI